jgi:hypothetical protein
MLEPDRNTQPPRGAARRALTPRRIRRLTAFGAMCVLLGLLLWARFLLVTGHPRTALAEPEHRPATPAAQAQAAADPGR